MIDIDKFVNVLFLYATSYYITVEACPDRAVNYGQGLLSFKTESLMTEFMLTVSESRSTPPWFQTLNKEFIRAVSFSEHETFDHPVGCKLSSCFLNSHFEYLV